VLVGASLEASPHSCSKARSHLERDRGRTAA
jgi:hypothetical protein